MYTKGKIYLVGDGILDNFFWLDNRDNDLSDELCKKGFDVNNLASDKMKLSNLKDGIVPDADKIMIRTYPYQLDSNNKLFPLSIIKKDISDDNNMAVLSIGGNNLNDKIVKLLLGVDYYINSILTKTFEDEFEEILISLKNTCPKIILISVYLPYLGEGSIYNVYLKYSKLVIGKWNNFLQKLAVKHDIPILDLHDTVDPYNRTHYGKVNIYPSNISSKCVAHCIDFIFDHYGGFKIYSCPKCNISRMIIRRHY